MTCEKTSGDAPPAPAVVPGRAGVGGAALYWVLVALQTAGAAIVLINGVPIYQQIATDIARHETRPDILWWAVAAVAIIQAAYWTRYNLRPPLPRAGHVIIAHLAGFIARLSFIFASSTFALVFFARFEQLSMPLPRVVMVVAVLFSMFCYTLELEQLARALQRAESRS